MSDNKKEYEYKEKKAKSASLLDDVRVKPQSIELEKCILASALLDEDVHEDVISDIKDMYFFDKRNEIIFRALRKMEEEHKPLDHNLLIEQLKSMGQYEQAGGEAYLSELLTTTGTGTNVKHYIKEIKDKWLLRTLIKTSGTILDESYETGADAEETLAKAEQRIFDIAKGESEKNAPVLLKTIMPEIFKGIERNMKSDGVTGLHTGFQELDETMTGLHPGELIVIGARPSMGKTALGLSMALEMAKVKDVKPIVIFSIEMPADQVVHRFLSAESSVNLRNIRGGLSAEELTSVISAGKIINELPIYICDGSVSVTDIAAKSRRIAKEHGGLGCIIIDYLQLITSHTENKSYNREQEVSQVSKALKHLSKELKAPIVALAQVSREVEKAQSRTSKSDGSKSTNKPRLSDLRESGAIEQDADAVLFIHRDSYYFEKVKEEDMDDDQKRIFKNIKNKAEIIVAKQRNGPTGTVVIGYLPEFAKFCEPLSGGHTDEHEDYEGGF
jgi:replicative DNA helicase